MLRPEMRTIRNSGCSSRPPAYNSTGSSLTVTLLAVLTVVTNSLWAPALAQETPTGGAPQSCDDAFADIYFMPDALNYPDGLPPGMTEGLPKQHLRLPRALLQLGLGLTKADYGWRYIYPRRLCDRTAFAAQKVFYANTPDLAQRLGLAYDAPSPHGDQVTIFNSRIAAPMDDSADREGTARQGYWVFDNKRGPGAAMYYFCVPPLAGPPKITGPCYVTANMLHMGYTTGTVHFLAQPFVFSTFYATDTRTKAFLRLVTPEILESYFAFLRTLAAKVIVDDTPNLSR